MRCWMILVLWANPLFAGDWHKLNTEGITNALTARVLQYSNATQNFFADGRTLYESPMPSWGKWRAQNDQYCSVWPPQNIWVCYDIERDETGLHIRFVSNSGAKTTGTYIDLN
jgi:hypothetical protein